MKKEKVKWSARLSTYEVTPDGSRTYDFKPPHYDEYDFGPDDPGERQYATNSPIATGEGVLDNNGSLSLSVPLTGDNIDRTMLLTVEGTVKSRKRRRYRAQ